MKKVNRLVFLVLVIQYFPVVAQVPTITSFSPTSGTIGTTVTITGTNFSSTPANNIVYFGTVRANVIAATVTQITVTVPGGLSYKPISVNVGGLSGSSRKPFITTFSGGPISLNTFSCPASFLGGPSLSGPNQEGAVGDIDNDGKPDISLISDYTSNTIEVRKNVCSLGVLNASSFESAVSYTGSFYDVGIDIQDIDGDGKLDLISDSRVLRNTSSPGSITASSFSASVNFAGPGTATVEPGDLDGDGKNDIVALDYFTNRVAVIKNNASPGTISAASFSSPIYFTTIGLYPTDIKLVDLDGDAKPEIILTCSGTSINTLSVFRNTSTSGSIDASSFASRLDFTTRNGPASLAIGDLNDDGKYDIVVANSRDNSLSIFQNLSTTGAIALASPITLVPGTKPMDIDVGDLDGDSKLDLIAANEGRYDPVAGFVEGTISILRNIHSSGILSVSSFSSKIDIYQGLRPSEVKIWDIDGEGRPDIIINGGEILLNKNGDPGLSISSFTPMSGPTGTTVTITGANFSTTPANNIVKFNGIVATVTASTTTAITTAVPSGATTGAISITVGCNSVTSGSNFTIGTSIVTIASFTPISGPIGTAVTITGSNFSATPTNNVVQFNGTTAIVTTSTTTSITATVPPGATTGTISVTVGANTATSSTSFCVSPPAPTVIGASDFPPAVLTLTASGGTNGQYRWYTAPTGGTALVGEVNGTYTTPSLTTSTTYYVSIDNGQCESSRTPVVAGIKVNSAPVILSTNAEAPVEGIITVSLTTLISDPEDNLDFSTLSIVSQPISGARATIEPVNNLVLDYSGISFSGLDQLTIGICDQLAACSQKELTIDVVGDITVYNAISANGDDKNPVFFLKNIDILADTKENKVTIFNRWGDIVFEAENYDNVNQVFRGQSNSGNELPSGTYYYRVEFVSGKETKMGFLALKK